MKILLKSLIILVISIIGIRSDCDVCQSTNNVACHKENQYSLCINGIPTRDYITCPANHVCTPDPYVCYPLPEAQPSCVRSGDMCGVCSYNKVYACINETTIAFCYGGDKPYEGADVSYCLDDTVCDLFSEHGFCTERHLAKPSCITTSEETTTTEITSTTQHSTTTVEPGTTTQESTIVPSTTTTTESTISTVTTETPTTATAKPTTPSTTQTTTTEAMTTTTTTDTEPSTISTVTTVTPTTATTTTTAIPTTPSTTQTTTTEAMTTTTTTEISTTESTTTNTEPSTTTQLSEPTTITTESTVTSAPFDPNEFCKDQSGTGSYYAGDPTCTTFVVCFSVEDNLLGLIKTCKDGQYFPPGAKFCSDEKTDECVSPITTTIATETTSLTTETTTTESTTTTTTTKAPSGPREPDEVCNDVRATGSFSVDDPTCRTFVVCYFMQGSFTGVIKSCKSGQYFSSTTNLCISDKPKECI